MDRARLLKTRVDPREHVRALSMQFLEYALVIEVRHSSWNRPEV